MKDWECFPGGLIHPVLKEADISPWSSHRNVVGRAATDPKDQFWKEQMDKSKMVGLPSRWTRHLRAGGRESLIRLISYIVAGCRSGLGHTHTHATWALHRRQQAFLGACPMSSSEGRDANRVYLLPCKWSGLNHSWADEQRCQGALLLTQIFLRSLKIPPNSRCCSSCACQLSFHEKEVNVTLWKKKKKKMERGKNDTDVLSYRQQPQAASRYSYSHEWKQEKVIFREFLIWKAFEVSDRHSRSSGLSWPVRPDISFNYPA